MRRVDSAALLKDAAAAGLSSRPSTPAIRGRPHSSAIFSRITLSRGLPIAAAMDEHTLLAFAMNGKPLLPIHGFPLRVVAAGYPGSAASAKWLTRIWVRDREHDGPGMTGTAYRVPTPVPDGARQGRHEDLRGPGIRCRSV